MSQSAGDLSSDIAEEISDDVRGRVLFQSESTNNCSQRWMPEVAEPGGVANGPL